MRSGMKIIAFIWLFSLLGIFSIVYGIWLALTMASKGG